MLLLAILLLIDLFYAWRFSKTRIDPDWAMFNFEGFTGSWYGRDDVDCKSPLVHLYYYAIARIVGKDVKAVRFVDQFIVGLPGVLLYGYTGNFWIGLAFVVLVHSGWLLSFHGNVGQLPAGPTRTRSTRSSSRPRSHC